MLREGMVAIRALLEGHSGAPDIKAAIALAEAMHNLQPNPMLIARAVDDLRQFCDAHPEVAATYLPETFAWVDR